MNFVDTILFNAKAVPDKPALILLDRVVTFGMFAGAVMSVESRARANGIKKDDTVAILISNPIRHLVAACALVRIGAVSVSVRGDQLGELPGIGATALLCEQATGPGAAGYRQIVIDDGWFAPSPDATAAHEGGFKSDDRIFRISLTSGTTGHSKAIAVTLRDFHDNVAMATPLFWAYGADRTLLLVGLSSSWAFAEAIRCLWSGRTVCFAASAPEALRMIPLFAIEALVASPQQMRVVVDSHIESPVSCASLRFVSVSGSQLGPSLATEIRARLCPRVIVNYGSAEAGKTAMAPLDSLRGIVGAAGFLLPWVEAEIVDATGQVLPFGQEGELRIRTAGAGVTYSPGQRTAAPVSRWFYPGDTARIFPDRMLVITGRMTELINAGGLKVAPEAVEELVADRADIKEAGAVALPGKSGVDEIWLAVVPRGKVEPAEIVAWCQRKAPQMAPQQVRIVDAIPRSDLGKVARERLKELLAG
jgi:acyl-coenzyme A synthetase/AMP-(fatty) acid ligase